MQDNEKKPALRFKGFTDPWEQRKLGELSCSFEYGLNAAAKEYDGQNKYLRITDIDDTSRQFVTTDITSPDTNLTDADSYKLSDGDVLFARTGASVGKTYLYKKFDGLVYFAGFLIRAKIKEGVNAGFIFQNTLTRGYERYIAITSQRSGQPGVNAQEYAEYQLMLPELFEQDKIAKLLEALDTLITLHQRKYEKLVNIKKSMLDKMFPKNGASVPEIRFKGFTDPWEQRKLGDITVELSEYATQELGLPLLTSSRSGLMYQDEYRDSRTTKSTETLFSVVPVGTCTYRHMSDDDVFHMNINTLEKGLVSREYPVFEASKGNNLEFLVQHINSSEEFKAFCAEQKKGGTRTRLYYNTLCQFTVRVPALKEQAQISQCLKKLDTLITLHQRKLEKLQNIKKSCLEKMFV